MRLCRLACGQAVGYGALDTSPAPGCILRHGCQYIFAVIRQNRIQRIARRDQNRTQRRPDWCCVHGENAPTQGKNHGLCPAQTREYHCWLGWPRSQKTRRPVRTAPWVSDPSPIWWPDQNPKYLRVRMAGAAQFICQDLDIYRAMNRCWVQHCPHINAEDWGTQRRRDMSRSTEMEAFATVVEQADFLMPRANCAKPSIVWWPAQHITCRMATRKPSVAASVPY